MQLPDRVEQNEDHICNLRKEEISQQKKTFPQLLDDFCFIRVNNGGNNVFNGIIYVMRCIASIKIHPYNKEVNNCAFYHCERLETISFESKISRSSETHPFSII